MAYDSGSSSPLSSSEESQILEPGTGSPTLRTGKIYVHLDTIYVLTLRYSQGYARRVKLVALNLSQVWIPDSLCYAIFDHGHLSLTNV